ncbi:unnamed protein product [marine sediment metagenome]|uniref:Uncharacterized protein n=1 Tax=marine sediment metagenome TaxID=412755 RepID=X1SUQ6_9ZZZZ
MIMNQKELEKRYRSKVKFWFERFEALSNITDKLQTELEAQRKIIEKVACENVQVINELRSLQQEKEEMEFDHIELQKQ